MGAAIVVENLAHSYDTPEGRLDVLSGLSFSVDAGDHVALRGQSGAGKSTLLAILGGLITPGSGHVRVGGTDVAALRGDRLAAYRRSTVGFVFQHFGLLDTLTALENIELAGTLAGCSVGPRRKRARELLDAVGVAGRAAHRPPQLSGGERQRVAIARALVNEPALILADEPSGNLDDHSTAGIMALLEDVSATQGVTLLVVTHDRAVAARARAEFILDAGRLAAA